MRMPVLGPGVQRGLKLESGRVYLRPPRLGDWHAWADLREESRAFLTPWEPTWPQDALGGSAFRRRVRTYSQEWRDGIGYSFLIFRRADDQLIGGVTLSNVRRGVCQSASLGYWTGQPHARRGHMTEALVAGLNFAFDDMALHRLEAACLPNNLASRRLLDKMGFREEGFAERYLRINGQWRDHVLFAMLCDEWRARGKR